ncbi:hypothetical protein ES702_01413 [subsurface metagenome]
MADGEKMIKKGELCTIAVFRAVWKILEESKNLEDAKEKYKALIPKLILEGVKDG